MAWRRPGGKPLSEPMVMTMMYICVTPPSNELNRPLIRYVKLRVAHAPGMPGTFSSPSRSRHASRHVRHARAVMHAGIAN